MLAPFLNVVKCLNSRKARYVVIGGNAAIFYGVPRSTFDLDLLIDPTPENAARVLNAFRDAKMGTADLITVERLLANEISIFNDWVPVDVQTRTPGLRFETAWKNRQIRKFHGIGVPFVSRADLIRSERAAGRPVDLEDVSILSPRRSRSRRPESEQGD